MLKKKRTFSSFFYFSLFKFIKTITTYNVPTLVTDNDNNPLIAVFRQRDGIVYSPSLDDITIIGDTITEVGNIDI